MISTPSNMSLAELGQQYKNGTIIIDHSYQRSLAWPAAAQSFLIDTILSGYPLPKLSLSQTTDLKTRATKKAIVDGQQRTEAIMAFLDNRLRVTTKKSKWHGKNFDQLEDEDKQRFLSYMVNYDLFTGATDEDVREVFRRMNWYTAPANDQEKRHSQFSGEFKQFISGVTKIYSPMLDQSRTFNKRQISRMADTEFLSECAYTYLFGIDNAAQPKLWRLYEENDEAFPDEVIVFDAFAMAFQRISAWRTVFDSSITKPYNMQSLITSTMHLTVQSPALSSFGTGELLPDNAVLENLARLDRALQHDHEGADMERYVWACSGATNRKRQRSVRFRYFMAALATGDFSEAHRRSLDVDEA